MKNNTESLTNLLLLFQQLDRFCGWHLHRSTWKGESNIFIECIIYKRLCFSSVQIILLFIHISLKDTYWNNIIFHGYNSTRDNLIVNEWYNSQIIINWHSLTICVPNPMPNPLHVIYLCFCGWSVTTTSKTHSYSCCRMEHTFHFCQSEDLYFGCNDSTTTRQPNIHCSLNHIARMIILPWY